jgi:signal transduction histidine kinase
MTSDREPRLVLRFAVASLIAFVVVGVGAMDLMVQHARHRAEAVGARHALFVGQSILAPAFEDTDLTRPLRGAAYEKAYEVVRERVLSDGVAVRVKIWAFDGTIVFSDKAALVGRRFPEEVHELEEVRDGAIEMGVSDLDEAENTFERDLADKLFFTYAPLRIDPGGPVVAVAEIYQDYAFIQDDIDSVVRQVSLILVMGLAVLYALLLPLAMQASRELSRRNERLQELLKGEQQTIAEMRELSKRKDDFVSAASHELRSPLTSILGSLATLKRSELRGDATVQGEMIEAAERQAKRLQRLIADVLSAAHLDGSGPVEMEHVDLADTASAVVAALEVSDRVAIDAPEQPVVTDRVRLTEVLTHLLANALEYSPRDSIVEVGASVDTDAFRVWVTDHGVGIDPSLQSSIFERFYQVDQSATRQHGGLGLGLHLAKELVEELGGRIEVASTPGRGSTFTVALPMGAVPRPAEHASASAG